MKQNFPIKRLAQAQHCIICHITYTYLGFPLLYAFRLVLRIRCDARKAVNTFGEKFGCMPTIEAQPLLEIAKRLNLNVCYIILKLLIFKYNSY